MRTESGEAGFRSANGASVKGEAGEGEHDGSFGFTMYDEEAHIS